jgi:outer membrane protein
MIQLRRALLTLGVSLLVCQQGYAASLMDVYQSAMLNDPSLREAEATRLAAYQLKPQARSNFLPQVDLTGNYNQQDFSGNQDRVTFAPDPIPIPTSYTGDSDNLSYTIGLRQTLFRWDQFKAYDQADKQVAKADVDYEIARQDLMLRVATRYFNVLAAKDTLVSAEAALDATARQLEQSEKRFEVGLIAITDVKESQAAYDNTTASVIAAKRQLATALEFLRELTGEYYTEFSKPGDSLPLAIPAPQDEQAWVDTAMQQNLSMVSNRISMDIARDDITLRRSGHLPTLDLVASNSWSDSTQNTVSTNKATLVDTEINQASDGDNMLIGIEFRIPIYSGGRTSSQVQQAVYQHRAAKERLERVMRETERASRDAYLGIMAEIARVNALKRAVESSQTALEATEAGFEVGTRTTVEVLSSRRTLFEAETNYARARYDYILNIIKLKQAAGILTESDIAQVNEWLDLSVTAR